MWLINVMKIVQQTPNLLRLQINNLGSVIPGVLLYILLFCGGLFGILQIQQSSSASWTEYIVPILFLLVGGGLTISNLFNAEFATSYIFDKSLGLLRMEQQTLFGTKINKWQLKEITLAELEEKTSISNDSNGFTRTSRTYYLKLNLKSDQHIFIPLRSCSTKQSNKIAASIRHFLNIN
jgi:hypothetical protein